MNQFPPGPLILPYIGHFNIFLNYEDIRSPRCTTGANVQIFYLDPIGKQFTLIDIFCSKKFSV
jgi:hypothetical protein